MTHRYHPSEQDKQADHTGKAVNDHNKLGQGKPTQANEGQRTPTSRHDREDHIGNNQVKVRRGTTQGTTSQQPPMKAVRGKGKSGM
jgi:hypothetical protein